MISTSWAIIVNADRLDSEARKPMLTKTSPQSNGCTLEATNLGMIHGADGDFADLSVARPMDHKTPDLASGTGVKSLKDGHNGINCLFMNSVDCQYKLKQFNST